MEFAFQNPHKNNLSERPILCAKRFLGKPGEALLHFFLLV